jgi:uncharacterized protein (TIGR03435 family)
VRLSAAFVILVSLTAALSAQSSSDTTPPVRFDTASIRPSGRTVFQAMRERALLGMEIHPVRVSIGHATPKELIQFAYGLDTFTDRIVGPDWLMSSDSFENTSKPGSVYDVEATFPAGTSEERVRRMLQTLLQDRFKLKTRLETVPTSVLLLVVARGGVTFKREESLPEPLPAISDIGLPGLSVSPSGKEQVRTIRALASQLTLALGVPVIDRTDLNGRYDIQFEVPAIRGVPGLPDYEASRGAYQAAYRAAVEDLGLGLVENQTFPSKRLIVEHMERIPSQQ